MKIDIKKFLKFRLGKWKNEDFWKWTSSQRREGWEWHHLVKRQHSDLFLVQIPSEQHKRIENSGYNEGEFEELFLISLLNIQKFIEEMSTNKQNSPQTENYVLPKDKWEEWTFEGYLDLLEGSKIYIQKE